MVEGEITRTCAACPVREACPPQGKKISLMDDIEKSALTPAERSHRLSLLRQDMRTRRCPPGEVTRLIKPLEQLIHPTRNPDFNTRIAPSATPDTGYVADRVAANHELLSRVRGLKGRRPNR
nr:hypothetical protein [Candidatus Levybacteria bacterium]